MMRTNILMFFAALLLLCFNINSQITENWKKYYNSLNDSEDASLGIVKDSQGNTYVTGYTSNSVNSRDMLIIKYGPNGELLWSDIYDNANSFDISNAVNVDNSGNVIITGETHTTPFLKSETFTIKYSSNGIRLWTKKFLNSNSLANDAGTGILVDLNNNIYVCGRYSPSNNTTNVIPILIKYDPNGNLQWNRIYSGNATGYSLTQLIRFDNNNNIVLAANIYNSNNSIINSDILINKINPNGNLLWSSTFSNPLNTNEDISGFYISPDNTIYLTGYRIVRYNNNDNQEVLTLKYSSNGNLVWSRFYNYLNNGIEYSFGNSIKTDALGNIYIAAHTSDSQNNVSGSALMKYSNSGSLIWVKNYNQPIDKTHLGLSVEIDGCNYPYLLGIQYGIVANDSFFFQIFKYNSSGNLLLQNNSYINNISSGSSHQIGFSVNWVNNTDFSITGSTFDVSKKIDIVTANYTQSFHSISGQVTYKDNNEPVPAGGYVKAFYYDNSTASIVIVDSAFIQNNGIYILQNVPQDSLDLMFYQDDDLLQYVPTYYQSTIDWREAQKVYADHDLTNINCHVYRISNTVNPFTISGQTLSSINTETSIPLKDVVVYAKIGNVFKNFSISNADGAYNITKLPAGTYTLTAHRVGFSPVTQTVTISNNGIENLLFNFGSPIGIQQISNEIPTTFFLSQNYPNPFNPVTTIRFALPQSGMVKLSVYDILGREIETLINENLNAASYSVRWNAENFPSGIYFYRIESRNFVETKKMVLIK